MDLYFFGVLTGLLVGGVVSYAYYNYYYFLINIKSIDPSFIRMWNDNMGYFSLSFIINPPKPDLLKSAPKKAKLTLIKETKND
jgi:hypothetical protein